MITRYDPDGGTLDEFVGPARHVHLERMDEGAWCLIVLTDTGEVRVWLSARRPGRTVVEATVTEGPGEDGARWTRVELPKRVPEWLEVWRRGVREVVRYVEVSGPYRRNRWRAHCGPAVVADGCLTREIAMAAADAAEEVSDG